MKSMFGISGRLAERPALAGVTVARMTVRSVTVKRDHWRAQKQTGRAVNPAFYWRFAVSNPVGKDRHNLRSND